MQSESRTRALFAFVDKRGNGMDILTYGGLGVVLVHKKCDAGKFELPRATRVGEPHIIVSNAIFVVVFAGTPSESGTLRDTHKWQYCERRASAST